MLLVCSLVFTVISLGFVILFTYESIREQESRATQFGLLIGLILVLAGIAIHVFPVVRIPYAFCAGATIVAGLIFSLPIKPALPGNYNEELEVNS